MTEIKHEQFGVRLVPRQPRDLTDRHVSIQLISEDDEFWFNVGNSFSAYWIDDLIAALQDAKTLLNTSPEFRKHEWGFDFVEPEEVAK